MYLKKIFHYFIININEFFIFFLFIIMNCVVLVGIIIIIFIIADSREKYVAADILLSQ